MTRKRLVGGLMAAFLLVLTLSAPLWAQFVDYSGSETTSVFKSIILAGTVRGEVTGPEITRVSSTEVGIPGVRITNIDAGSSGVAGTVDVFPAPAAESASRRPTAPATTSSRSSTHRSPPLAPSPFPTLAQPPPS
jgi:hypothetical protein